VAASQYPNFEIASRANNFTPTIRQAHDCLGRCWSGKEVPIIQISGIIPRGFILGLPAALFGQLVMGRKGRQT
jgi:hypothetical protein